jgi:outer membrane biosynthesis protein TonB
MQEKIELEVPIDDKKAAVVPFVLPKTILDVQRSAVGDTLYWTSMSQVSRNDMGAAVATLRSYRRQYPGEKSFYASLINEAEALIILGDLKSAAVALKEADVDTSPDRARAQWMLNRLGAAAVPAEAAPAENPASPEKPSEPTPAEPKPAEPTAEKPEADKPASEPATPAESKSETPAAESPKPAETDPAANSN